MLRPLPMSVQHISTDLFMFKFLQFVEGIGLQLSVLNSIIEVFLR